MCGKVMGQIRMKHFLYIEYKKAFTLLELLVVIAIIGILAAASASLVTGVREKAQITAVISDVKAIEKAFIAYRLDNPGVYIPTTGVIIDMELNSIENILATGGVPNQFPGFGLYLSSLPEPPGQLGYYAYYYDFNNVTCFYGSGVNIVITSTDPDDVFTQKLFTEMDRLIDGEDQLVTAGSHPDSCGRVRIGGPNRSIFYLIAEHGSDLTI